MTEAPDIKDAIGRARRLAEQLATLAPWHPLYQAVIARLDAIEAALPRGPHRAYEASGSLIILAVRELDELPGLPSELASVIFEFTHELRKMAGLPPGGWDGGRRSGRLDKTIGWLLNSDVFVAATTSGDACVAPTRTNQLDVIRAVTGPTSAPVVAWPGPPSGQFPADQPRP